MSESAFNDSVTAQMLRPRKFRLNQPRESLTTHSNPECGVSTCLPDLENPWLWKSSMFTVTRHRGTPVQTHTARKTLRTKPAPEQAAGLPGDEVCHGSKQPAPATARLSPAAAPVPASTSCSREPATDSAEEAPNVPPRGSSADGSDTATGNSSASTPVPRCSENFTDKEQQTNGWCWGVQLGLRPPQRVPIHSTLFEGATAGNTSHPLSASAHSPSQAAVKGWIPGLV